MSKTLFEIKEEHLETGMRGFPVGYCPTSFVDPEMGLEYRGIPIPDLKEKSPEEVIYLLIHGKLPTKEELFPFHKTLASQATCKKEVIESIGRFPRQCHPMALLSMALLTLGTFEQTKDYRQDALAAIAKIPHLAAAVINTHAGWGATKDPDPNLSLMENFANMVNVPNGDKELLTKVFSLFHILHMDHGGGNLSAFVGKAVASGLATMYGSLSSAMCALAGPRHGKANQDSLSFIEEIYQAIGDKGTEADVEAFIRQCVAEKRIVYGFGHAVLRVEDPRASIMYEFVKTHFPDFPLVKVAQMLRSAGPKVLSENPKIQDPYPNIDAVSGSMLSAAGFGYPNYFTILFGMARVVGIAIQIVYERCIAREGKGTPIIRPKYIFKNK